MDSLFIDRAGKADEYLPETRRRRPLHFPLCVAVKYNESVSACPDFVLNAGKREIFIRMDPLPVPRGALVTMHFYIPPEDKLLGEFKGKVVGVKNSRDYPQGLHIRFVKYKEEAINRLVDYLRESRHLVDKKI